MDIKKSIIKNAQVVFFAMGVLPIVTGCAIETNVEEQQKAPEAPVVLNLPSERQPFLAPKKIEVVMDKTEERVSYPNAKKIVRSTSSKASRNPESPRVGAKFSVNQEQLHAQDTINV